MGKFRTSYEDWGLFREAVLTNYDRYPARQFT